MIRRLAHAVALLACAWLAAACASLPGPADAVAPTDDCARWFARLDAAIDAAGVRDAQDERHAALPGLRVDRLGAALRGRAAASDAAFSAWLSHAAALEAAAREAELANLPREAFPLEAEVPDARAALARSARCRDERVVQAARAPAHDRARWLASALVPDRYRSVLRALGLYPLARWPFFAGVQRWQDDHAREMARWSDAPPAGLARHVPPAVAPGPLPPWRADALGVPRLAPDEAARWLAAHAPVFEIETTGAHDAFGTPRWSTSAVPQVDTRTAVVYQRIAYTVIAGQVWPQLVYTLWFPERPLAGSFDLLGGALDGVIVRLTLAPDGRVRLMDTIHACGCYHLFFPAADVTPRPDPPRHVEWAFTPARLPTLGPGERLVVRIATRTHYVSGIARAGTGGGTAYALRPEEELRHLPAPDETTRSLYGPDGLVAGSQRRERYFFWPMGIASAGAMRQWGHHATAFVGRRHFDDADLLDRRFDFALPH